MFQNACPLNPGANCMETSHEYILDFSKRFSPCIRNVVDFAKRIPGFTHLAQDDMVTLLKGGVFEVLLVRLSCLFDGVNMVCLNGQVLRREAVHNNSARFLLDSIFDFQEQLNSLRLSDAEIGLYCAVIIITADRPGIRNTEFVAKIHNRLKSALQFVISQNHSNHLHIMEALFKKLPDLRTLNTLHSEKVLVNGRIGPQIQQEIWPVQPMEEDHSTSPPASTWSSGCDGSDEAKSPGSVSSPDSVSSPEMTSVNEHNQTNHVSPNVASAPLLAATLAGGLCPHRNRANSGSTTSSGSTSSNDEDFNATSHLIHNGLTITPVTRPSNPIIRFRKSESPTDSGIESGTERAPTSICSSPRSSMDDHHIVEDMPVLKRVLQAPPLYDTNSLMDEAYKPHKKFRALRNKDSAEAEPLVIKPPPAPMQSQLQMQLSAPPQSSLSSTHSTLAKSLMEGPRMTAEQLKRTDIIHNFIMRNESASPMVTAPTSCPYKPPAGMLQSWATTSVITTTARQASPPQQPPIAYQRVFLQSPHSTSPSRSSPGSRSPNVSPPHPVTTKMVELQVDIADSQQPLNLSKKSPSPPPHQFHVVTLEV